MCIGLLEVCERGLAEIAAVSFAFALLSRSKISNVDPACPRVLISTWFAEPVALFTGAPVYDVNSFTVSEFLDMSFQRNREVDRGVDPRPHLARNAFDQQGRAGF